MVYSGPSSAGRWRIFLRRNIGAVYQTSLAIRTRAARRCRRLLLQILLLLLLLLLLLAAAAVLLDRGHVGRLEQAFFPQCVAPAKLALVQAELALAAVVGRRASSRQRVFDVFGFPLSLL